jgi:hypothetical protein
MKKFTVRLMGLTALLILTLGASFAAPQSDCCKHGAPCCKGGASCCRPHHDESMLSKLAG